MEDKVKALGQKMVTGAKLRLKDHCPFFAHLLMFVQFIPCGDNEGVPTACTNGSYIKFNVKFFQSMSTEERDAVFLHEVLHAALLHPARVRPEYHRPDRWNIACDIVVNGIIAKVNGVRLPTNAIRAQKIEHLSVEEVYELLEDTIKITPEQLDILKATSSSECKKYWQSAIKQAEAHSRMVKSAIPEGFKRFIDEVTGPQIDWKSALWRFIVRTPTDFSGFDRRFFHRKLYIEDMDGETVRAAICIDTSGSIDDKTLTMFMSEVRGILRAYPHIIGELYYADADVYGPKDIFKEAKMPAPEGGGGTSFVPFFEKTKQNNQHELVVAIYLTDGFGDFPEAKEVSIPTIWVVVPGGLDNKNFPFGEVARMI